MSLPKLLTLTFYVLGLEATVREMMALLHVLLWACPLLGKLDMHIPNLYEDTALTMEGMVTAANEKRCEEEEQLTASFYMDDQDFGGVT